MIERQKPPGGNPERVEDLDDQELQRRIKITEEVQADVASRIKDIGQRIQELEGDPFAQQRESIESALSEYDAEKAEKVREAFRRQHESIREKMRASAREELAMNDALQKQYDDYYQKLVAERARRRLRGPTLS